MASPLIPPRKVTQRATQNIGSHELFDTSIEGVYVVSSWMMGYLSEHDHMTILVSVIFEAMVSGNGEDFASIDPKAFFDRIV